MPDGMTAPIPSGTLLAFDFGTKRIGIAVGNTVVDHELVIRAPGGEQFEIIAIYTFKDGLISRVDFAK